MKLERQVVTKTVPINERGMRTIHLRKLNWIFQFLFMRVFIEYAKDGGTLMGVGLLFPVLPLTGWVSSYIPTIPIRWYITTGRGLSAMAIGLRGHARTMERFNEKTEEWESLGYDWHLAVIGDVVRLREPNGVLVYCIWQTPHGILEKVVEPNENGIDTIVMSRIPQPEAESEASDER